MIRFVTGTGTGVGKTIACVALARAEQEAGRPVRYCKPVQTGAAGDDASDADTVRLATGVDARALRRLPEPLAPAVAAALAGTAIDVAELAREVRELDLDTGTLLVEGAGGLLVPLTETATMAELAGALGAELVVVTTAGLGTLNHTALTLEAASARRLRVAGIVVAMLPHELGVVERTNLEQLAAMAPVLGAVSLVDHPGEAVLSPLPPRGATAR